MSRETVAFIAQVEGILNAPDPSQEPLAMWLRRTLEKYREANQMWERRIEESREKNVRITALTNALREHLDGYDLDQFTDHRDLLMERYEMKDFVGQPNVAGHPTTVATGEATDHPVLGDCTYCGEAFLWGGARTTPTAPNGCKCCDECEHLAVRT